NICFRAELEATYAKGLSKLSSKLTKACAKDQGGNSNGGVNEAWRCVGEEMEAAAEAHRLWGIALSEQLAKPLRVGVAETQGRSRKSIENSVDKASKSLQEWRGVTAKSKKQSFACARENERLQDLARLQTIGQSQQSNNRSSSHHMTEKEASKLEARRRKAEDSSRRADTEFYTVSVRAERARLEYESTMRKGAKQMELLEEERLSALKDLANVYLTHLQALAPRLQQSVDRLLTPVRSCNVSQDLEILKNLVRRMDNHDVTNAEQLLPDFYAEHVTLAMNRERRKQALVRVLHLIRQDLERERRGREGLETLHRAFVKTPAFAADESTQNVTDKLHHMRSMLLYLEAARYKVGGTLAEVEGSKRSKHPLSEHILVSRDKQGLQQSVLKIPSWTKNESFEIQDSDDELEMHLTKDQNAETRDWADRTAGDGNSENPPDEDDFSDFDEFSSHSEDNNNQIDGTEVATAKTERTEQCRAIYQYSANLNDELSLSPGDLITVHQKQPDGWWIGECRGRTGIFPATYVQVIH
ncbi:nostrin-like, partial [Temnothorax curvispinosus]|uniref:Nostrin-like n=1 Tax=Temnothorax curvispinosus TaxID=300111 RepID=A0A6J1PU29_9HYME